MLVSGGIGLICGYCDMVNFVDGIIDGYFGSNQSFVYGDDFVVCVSGEFNVSSVGIYIFGINIDDGVWVCVDGVNVIVDDSLYGLEDYFGQVMLIVGIYSIEVVYFECLGGVMLELFMVFGFENSFSFCFSLMILLMDYQVLDNFESN